MTTNPPITPGHAPPSGRALPPPPPQSDHLPGGGQDIAYPPGPPFTPMPTRRARRRWPSLLAGAVGIAAVAATAGSLVTANIGGGDAGSGSAVGGAPAATITVTAEPPVPEALPAAQADRQTCTAWKASGSLINSAYEALSVIPEGTTILDPSVQDTPTWKAAVLSAATMFEQAGEKLADGIAPGTTPVLEQSSRAAAAALQALSTSYRTFDTANGFSYAAAKETGDAVDLFCERFAP